MWYRLGGDCSAAQFGRNWASTQRPHSFSDESSVCRCLQRSCWQHDRPVDRSLFKPGDNPMPNDSPITAEEENAIQYVKGVKDFYGHIFMYMLFVAVFGYFLGFKHPFILWGSIGWGIGLIVHGLNVVEVINFLGPNWGEKKVEKRLGRLL